MATLDEMIAVMTAAKEGKPIQTRWVTLDGEGTWTDDLYPNWDWKGHDYRVKPEPRKPREFWVNTFYFGSPTGYAYTSKNDADKCAGRDRAECIRVREVLEES